MPAITTNFPDPLDPRFRRIWDERFTNVPDKLGVFYNVQTQTLETERMSTIGTFGEMQEFSGQVDYDDVYQGYDTTATAKEFSKGFQVERRLWEFEQFGIMDKKPKALAGALYRRRQNDGARIFNSAFSVDTFFYNNSENVALCSNSHTTTSGASTASGFDNLILTAFSATALASARIQMVNFKGDRAEKIQVMPDMVVYPVDLYQTVHEVLQSQGKPATGNNDSNVHFQAYKDEEWIYLDDVNNWFLVDSSMMKEYLTWFDKIKGEFAMVEDFDTLIAKWRCYSMYTIGCPEWRWILGASVS